MTQQIINVGAIAYDSTADTLRAAFTKCNMNFTERFAAAGLSAQLLLINIDSTPGDNLRTAYDKCNKNFTVLFAARGMGAQQLIITIGMAPDDGTGDDARSAFIKCNINFTALYGAAMHAASVEKDIGARAIVYPPDYHGQEIIDIGVIADDGTGDNLRVAFNKVNHNFTDLYSGVAGAGSVGPTGPAVQPARPVPQAPPVQPARPVPLARLEPPARRGPQARPVPVWRAPPVRLARLAAPGLPVHRAFRDRLARPGGLARPARSVPLVPLPR
jgi:hypothetical protein